MFLFVPVGVVFGEVDEGGLSWSRCLAVLLVLLECGLEEVEARGRISRNMVEGGIGSPPRGGRMMLLQCGR